MVLVQADDVTLEQTNEALLPEPLEVDPVQTYPVTGSVPTALRTRSEVRGCRRSSV